MKNLTKIVLFLVGCTLIGCSNQAAERYKEHRAERELAQMAQAIESNDKDRLWQVSQQSDDIYYFIKAENAIVFWSNNVLTARSLTVTQYDEWYEETMYNARCRCLWKRVGTFDVLAAIPIEWKIDAKEEIERSFSYRALLPPPPPTSHDRPMPRFDRLRVHTRAHALYMVSLGLIIAIFIFCMAGIIRARGVKRLSLRLKVLDTILGLLLISFAAVFFLSVQYLRTQSVHRQERELEEKCRTVRMALDENLQGEYSIHAVNAEELSNMVNHLSHLFHTDIHLYDLDGRLVTTSTPQLFDRNVLPRFVDPKVLYSNAPELLCHNSIGTLNYLSANTMLMNRSRVPLGYLTIPFFVSEEMVTGEVEHYLAWLLPIDILVLLIAIALGIWLSRVISESFTKLNNEKRELIIASAQQAKEEREKAWCTMARQIAHEINNPLTPMKLTLQQMQRVKGTGRFDELFDRSAPMLVDQIDNLSRIASSFSAFAQMPQVEVSTIDVAQKLCDVIALFQTNEANVPIRYVGPDQGVEVYADKNQIGQVFTNLIKNAIQALQGVTDGDVLIVLKQLQDEVEISVSDNGVGIADELQDKIFAPYFTTKTTGTGLGLAISKHIVECAGGRITFQTSNKGTTFYVYLKKL